MGAFTWVLHHKIFFNCLACPWNALLLQLVFVWLKSSGQYFDQKMSTNIVLRISATLIFVSELVNIEKFIFEMVQLEIPCLNFKVNSKQINSDNLLSQV